MQSKKSSANDKFGALSQLRAELLCFLCCAIRDGSPMAWQQYSKAESGDFSNGFARLHRVYVEVLGWLNYFSVVRSQGVARKEGFVLLVQQAYAA